MMNFTYVQVQSDMKTIILIQNMHFNESHLKLLHQPKCCVYLIDNKAYAPIFVMGENDR